MRRRMAETAYRASRVCRILGNPTAYQVIKLLLNRPKTPGELADEIGVSVTTISDVLRHLRNIDLVRYEVRANERIYWIKDASVSTITKWLENFVRNMRYKQW
uniref:ArsR family transcriptional regulator n=1 Tax=candidate division WOR-3 bacterium TaxID=2052148 RepID=A0A7V1EI91_UNCW3